MLGGECEWRPIVLGRIKLNSFSLKYLISKTLIISSYVIVVFLIFCIYCILHHWKTIKIKQLINPQKYGIVQTVAVVLILEFCARGKVATFCRNWLFYILLFTGKNPFKNLHPSYLIFIDICSTDFLPIITQPTTQYD